MSGHHDDSEGHDKRPVVAKFTPAQATALYDLACWAMDDDQDHGELRAYLDTLDNAVLKAAAAAIIDGGGNGHDYV